MGLRSTSGCGVNGMHHILPCVGMFGSILGCCTADYGLAHNDLIFRERNIWNSKSTASYAGFHQSYKSARQDGRFHMHLAGMDITLGGALRERSPQKTLTRLDPVPKPSVPKSRAISREHLLNNTLTDGSRKKTPV
jgi:hypothetical protein